MMSGKLKKLNANIKTSTSDNILQKRLPTASKEFRGTVNEGEFCQNFRKFCVECNTTLVPNVKLVTADDLRDLPVSVVAISKQCHSLTSTISKPQSEHTDEDALATIPEILVVQDDANNAIAEMIFRQFPVNKNMLVALTKTLKTGILLRSLKLEFCQLTFKEIRALSIILRMIDTITEVSVNGNPNKSQNFDLLLHETKLLTLSLRFCRIDEEGAKRIAQRINSFAPEVHLMHLNLSSNSLGDEGAAEIAKTLRVNRSLLILNLADNQITDKGCEKIAESLQSFALKAAEVKLRRMRIFDYYKRKQDLLDMMTMSKSKITVSGSTNLNKRSKESVRKSREQQLVIKKEKSWLKPISSAASSKKSGSTRSKSQTSRSEKEKINSFIGEGILPTDLHPFVKNTDTVNCEWYCVGNNKLMSLNLAYNKITHVGLRVLIQMLQYQKNTFMLPDIGILRMCLEGNSAPNCCSEINEILDLINNKTDSVHGSLSSRNKLSALSQQ